MKYENIVSGKLFKLLEKLGVDKKVIDKEEKFFNRFKNATKNLKKQ